MKTKRGPGRPPGALNKRRKGSVAVALSLAPDLAAALDAEAARAGTTRTATAERWLRMGIAADALTAAPPAACQAE